MCPPPVAAKGLPPGSRAAQWRDHETKPGQSRVVTRSRIKPNDRYRPWQRPAGELTLAYEEAIALPADPGLQISACTAEPGTPSGDALNPLARWAATPECRTTLTRRALGGGRTRSAGRASGRCARWPR
jgi:hypothetical protein